jgi:hypothetical protein
MKNTNLLLTAVFASLMTSAALGQPAPTDAKILHDASAILETEKAFRGLLIVPSVSHGVVTLTGTVSSEGDKVLASIEVGRVDGVRTVLNNLDVRNGGAPKTAQLPALTNPDGAQGQALTREGAAPVTVTQAISTSTITIPVGSLLQIRLVESISTKTAKPGDQFHGTLAAAVSTCSTVAIPAGTSVLGRVVSAKSAGHFVSAAELSLELMSVRLPGPDGRGEDVGIITDYLSSEGKGRGTNTVAKTGGGAAVGAIIGALAGGGTGAAVGASAGGGLGIGSNAVTVGGQIELHPEALLRFRTAAPITTTVYEKNGAQIQLPASSGPALLPRAAAEAQTQ